MLGDIPVTLLNGLGVVGLWSVIGALVLTRKLVWHTDLEAVERREKEWRDMALRGLGVAEQATVHAETLVKKTAPETTPETAP
jgi:hypothetical protein